MGAYRLDVVGGLETDEFKRQAQTLSNGPKVDLLTVACAHHMSILGDLHSPDSALIKALRQWAGGAEFPSEVDTITA